MDRAAILLSLITLAIVGWTGCHPAPSASSDATTQPKPSQTPALRKILFLGNSITLHGPKPDIGWTGNWGMAASSEDKDYVHQVVRSLVERQGVAPEIRVRNIADFERQYRKFSKDPESGVKEDLDWNPDVVVLAIGENVPALNSADDKVLFHHAVTRLLTPFKTRQARRIVVRSCFWPDSTKDQILRDVTQEVGAIFADISTIGRDPANAARSERPFTHDGVSAHPGDKGMRAIADALVNALSSK